MRVIEISELDYPLVIAEWWRRYREEPERFLSDYQTALKTPLSLGESDMAYFILLMREMGVGAVRTPGRPE